MDASKIKLLPGEKTESLNIKDYGIIQSDDLYKFTSDPVLLSRFAKKGAKNVLDLCSGSGILSLHYYALNDDTVERVTCVEIQPELALMNEKSVLLNGLEEKFTVVNKPLQEVDFFGGYDLVLCNPPYEKAGCGIPPKSRHLAVCRTEEKVTLEDIVYAASRALDRGGTFALCHKAPRIAEILSLFEKYGLCPSRLRFVSGGGEKAYLVLAEGVKGKKTETEVYNTVINDFRDFSGQK